MTLTASHDGYRRLDDPVRHTRTFVWLGETGLVVVDHLDAREQHQVASRVPLAEGLPATDGASLPGDLRLAALGKLPCGEPITAWRAPYLGTTVPIDAAETRGAVAPGERFGWSILRHGFEAELDGLVLRVTGPGMDLRLPT